ncbi:MAG: alpha/beta hydrolase [Coriobacteriia bacterium]|nr:alpha/beta hydrolase [Coriobacteriia bacterium]
MRHVEGSFTGAGGLGLHIQQWLPDAEPKAAFVLIHGIGEHSGRYPNLVEPLARNGYAVWSFDQRGHGRSEGRRCHVDSWSQYLDDLDAFLDLVASELPDAPQVIYGHSMGSLIALDYLLERERALAGAIISGVALEPAGVSKPYLIAAAKTLSRLAPHVTADLKIDAADLSRDPIAVATTRADPMMMSRATMRWGAEGLAAVDRIKAKMSSVDLPLLILHGESDRLNMSSAAQALYDSVGCEDKRIHIYEGAYHEPHNDYGHEQLVSDVVEWLDRVTAPAA